MCFDVLNLHLGARSGQPFGVEVASEVEVDVASPQSFGHVNGIETVRKI